GGEGAFLTLRTAGTAAMGALVPACERGPGALGWTAPGATFAFLERCLLEFGRRVTAPRCSGTIPFRTGKHAGSAKDAARVPLRGSEALPGVGSPGTNGANRSPFRPRKTDHG
ncbi:hypothetical protein P7K49_012868, partial [Saguinus oedipus]